MRGVDKAIYDLISENAHVQAIMGVTRKEDVNVCPYNPDSQVEVPSITFYERDSDSYLNIPRCELLTYKIDIWTASLETSTRLGNTIDEMLSVRNQENEYAVVYQFTLFTANDIFEEQTQTYHRSLTYKVIAIDKESI